MIKKLQRNFTGIALLLCGIILSVLITILFSILYVSSYTSINNHLEAFARDPIETYNRYYNIENNDELYNFSYMQSVCVVSLSSNDTAVKLSSTGTLSDETLVYTINYVKDKKDGFGRIDDANLFYYKITDSFSTRLAFADSARFFKAFDILIVDLVAVFLIVMLLLYIVIRFVVRLSLKPLEKVWTQQQNFIADASHELKTPLTVILTNTNILMSHKKDTIDNQMMWVNSTYEESKHMKDLVEKLLLLAKTDNINQKNLFTTVNLSELMIRLSLQYEPVAFEQGVILNTDIQNGVFVKGEPTALNQIIHILLDNAIKYAGIGGEITLTLKKVQKYVYITANNTGTPIPEEDRAHIFERFYRSDKVRTTGNGYGLGLAICKNLVEIHKGDITCASNIHDGTTFTVRLKATKDK